SPRALRYYEEQGLLAPQRTQGGQRRYPVDAVERVLLYRRLIDAGLGTEVIRELVPRMNGSAGADTVATLEREHAKLLDQARELEATADRLADTLKSLCARVLRADGAVTGTPTSARRRPGSGHRAGRCAGGPRRAAIPRRSCTRPPCPRDARRARRCPWSPSVPRWGRCSPAPR